MKVHTSEFKEEIKKLGRQLSSKITYGETELGNEELNSVTPHYESTILKSVMKQLDVDSNVEIPIETIINYQFGVKVGNGYEYLDYGNYVVYKVEKQEDTRSWKITCYDKMLYAMKPYESLGVSFPISIKDYLQAICTKLGLTLASGNFANEDKMIMNELYLDASGNGLDYTFRDVLDEIAQATGSTICINENDELEVRYPKNVGEYETIEGTDLHLENVDDGKDIDYELNGDTTQDGTPTPESPIEVQTVTGRQVVSVSEKNLLNSSRGFTNAYITSTGTISGNAPNNALLDGYIRVKPNTTYTYSCNQTLNNMAISEFNDSQAFIKRNTNQRQKKLSITTTNTTNYVRLTFNYDNTTTITQSIIDSLDLMLCEGTDTTYEEYKGQSYEVDLGKNLLNIQTNINANTGSGLVLTYNSDGSFTMSGTTTRTYGYVTSYYNVNIPPGTYTLSIKEALTHRIYLNLTFEDNTTGSITILAGNTSQTNTIAKTIKKIQIAVSTMTNSTYYNETIYIMLEKGTQSTSFSPYKTPIELCKIGNYQDRIFKSKGKQLFDKGNINLIDSYYVDGTGKIVAGTNNKFNWVKLEPNKTYTLSQPIKSNVTVRPALFNTTPIANATGTVLGTFTGTTPIIQTFTTTDTDIYFGWVYCNTAQLSGHTQQEMLDSIMLNEGSTALPYEPYNSVGKWLLHKEIGKYVYNNDLNTNGITTNYIQMITPVLNIESNLPTSVVGSKSLCNIMSSITTNYTGLTGTTSQNRIRLNFSTNYVTTYDEVRELCLNNNLTIYYGLATPTTTEITDTELINQLKAVELLEGMNNISITSSNLSSPLKLTYLSQMDTIDEEYLKDVNVNFGEKFGPVNSVVLSRAAESDSIYQMDDESVEQNGLTEVKIKDNQILNGNNRDEFLPSIFEKLNGLEYYLTDFSSTGVTYYDLLDKYKINVFDNSYKTIMLNNEVDITQGLEEQIYADRLEESETDYTKYDKTDRKINQAYIIVDKQNQQINSVVQSINTLQSVVNNQGEQVDALGTRLTQTVDNITASVTSIQTELDNGVSLVKTTSVTIDDNGLNVSTDNSKISTTMTNNSFEIKDSGDNMLAFFGYDETENISKSQMDNLTVTNYFVSGYHRTEKFERNGERRTGHFYIG